MQIELSIKRPGGTEVDMPNEGQADTRYHFKPVDASRADSPHVANVENDDHAEMFLRADPSYRIFKAGAKVELAKPVSAPSPVIDVATVASDSDERPSYNALKSGIAKDAYSQEQLREFLAAEEASESPRPGYVAAITKALT